MERKWTTTQILSSRLICQLQFVRMISFLHCYSLLITTQCWFAQQNDHFSLSVNKADVWQMIEQESHSLRKEAALLTCGRSFARRQQVVVGLGVVIKSCFGSAQAFRQYQKLLVNVYH